MKSEPLDFEDFLQSLKEIENCYCSIFLVIVLPICLEAVKKKKEESLVVVVICSSFQQCSPDLAHFPHLVVLVASSAFDTQHGRLVHFPFFIIIIIMDRDVFLDFAIHLLW